MTIPTPAEAFGIPRNHGGVGHPPVEPRPVIPASDPADLPLSQLKVVPLGEDGDAYIVEGTANPIVAQQALVAWWRETNGPDDDDAIMGQMLPEARVDWWWQNVDGDTDIDAEFILRAKLPNEAGVQWGGADQWGWPHHADQPLFRGVYFG